MNDKPEDDIHNVTNKRLAEILEQHNQWRRGLPPYDEPGAPSPISPQLLGQAIDEAARRLRERKRLAFNHEAFDL